MKVHPLNGPSSYACGEDKLWICDKNNTVLPGSQDLSSEPKYLLVNQIKSLPMDFLTSRISMTSNSALGPHMGSDTE